MLLRLISLTFLSFFLSACSTPTLKLSEDDRVKIQNDAKDSDKSIALLIEEYQTKMLSFGPESFELYAPGSYQLAQSKYQQAKAFTKDDHASQNEEAKFAILGAHHLLDTALKQRAAVKLHLKKADAHFTELQKIEAPTLFPEKFDFVSQSFTELITLLEQGEIQTAISDQDALIEKMIELEILSLKKKHIGQSKAYLSQSIENNAEDYMRERFNLVERLINETESFIDKNYRNRNSIHDKSVIVDKEAKQLYYISAEIQTLLGTEDSKLGDKMSERFALFNQITEALKIEAIPYDHFPAMTETLINKLDHYVSSKPTTESPKVQNKAEQHTNNAPIEVSPLPEKAITPAIISTETNKAVLPELLNHSDMQNQNQDDENMEFDSIEYVE